ncbi:hypothetical protein ES332_D11G084100v1 [Gossypium tomentosum]|uniref:Ancestral coatomer element 1 Sec16/Sec31 domain-containing protein n=2 Tax=Gossypium tomentosum TaxID=34277 RepID=A0A5D2IJU1_GOSTO|nr:hypothetical protein ES332_D11G084100v1 [Gossypium tomentosum]
MCRNIDKTVEIWSSCLTTENDGKSYVDLLQDLMEKTIVLALATGQKLFSASLCKLVENYAENLASQGLLTTAMGYLKLFGSDELSPELMILKDRIAFSTGHEKETSASDFGNSHPASGPVFEASQQANFAPSPGTTQPAVRPFVPSNPPVLRNADKYQQPTTLGSQLYPGGAYPTYPLPHGAGSLASVPSPMGSVPGPKVSQAVAPTSTPRGFMPVTNPPVVQRPGMGPMQPPSPTQPRPVQPAAAPAAPPPTVQTVDTSNVPAHQKPVITTLTGLFNETSQALGGSRANPAKKREIEGQFKENRCLICQTQQWRHFKKCF